MFQTLGRSISVGLFAAVAGLGAVLGASGIASAAPQPGDDVDMPVPTGEIGAADFGAGPHSKLPAVDPGSPSSVGELPAVILNPNAIGSILTPTM